MYSELIKWSPLLGVIIAGSFAIFQIKANNVTNARIKWLDNLKQVVTDFLSEGAIIQLKHGIQKEIDERGVENEISKDAKDFSLQLIKDLLEHLKLIELKYNLIVINLNPKEPLHQKLEKHLKDYMDLFNEMPLKKKSNDHKALMRTLEAHSDTLSLLIRYTIKLEWERTKRTSCNWRWYKKCGKGKGILDEALNLELLPERPYIPAEKYKLD